MHPWTTPPCPSTTLLAHARSAQVVRLPKPPAKPKRGGKGRGGGGAAASGEDGEGNSSEGEDEEDDEGRAEGEEQEKQEGGGGAEGGGGKEGGAAGAPRRAIFNHAHATALAKLPAVIEWLASALGTHKGRARADGKQRSSQQNVADSSMQRDGGARSR